LNGSVAKPVKRENSNTTNATHATGITAVTASTANSHNGKNAAFYSTQYNKGGNGKGFFPAANGGANATLPLGTDGSEALSHQMATSSKNRQQQ
jgi:hypothetical protein